MVDSKSRCCVFGAYAATVFSFLTAAAVSTATSIIGKSIGNLNNKHIHRDSQKVARFVPSHF